MVTRPNRRPHVVSDPVLDRRIEEWSLEAVTAPTPAEPAKKEAATVGFNFKMTPSNHARLKRLAAREGRSLQNVLNLIVWPAIAEREREG